MPRTDRLAMATFEVRGGTPLCGEITPQGAKNEALQVICATLLTPEKVTIRNIPAIVVPLVWSCSDRHVREIPLEEFFRNSEVRSYDISPDGKYLSYMAPYESRMNIFVQQAGSDSARRITSETDRDIAGYFWANNDRLLYLKDTGGDENYQLYGVNLDGSDPKAYTAIPGVRTQIIDPLEEIDSLIIVSPSREG